jgi:hypothetical protein
VQLHPTRTPLAADVDFARLARDYAVSGGDIRNAVLKAALSAAAEPGRDSDKRIAQRHLEAGIQDVIAGRKVMQQSIAPPARADTAPAFDQLFDRLPVQPTAWPIGLSAAAFVIAVVALAVALMR